MKLTLAARCAVLAASLCAASSLYAANFVVNSLADSGSGSLRQAILNANAGGGGNIIFSNVSGTITLAANLPSITASVKITGPGANVLTVSGSNTWSVFTFNLGTTNTMTGLTVANTAFYRTNSPAPPTTGVASGAVNYGSLKVQNCVFHDCDNLQTYGGAIGNWGALELDNSLVANCGFPQGPGNPKEGVSGSGVYNGGSLVMNVCVISNCIASYGGGFYNASNAVLTGCTIQNCKNDWPDSVSGGGIKNAGNLTLVNSLVSSNNGGWPGGGISSSGPLTMSNTIVAGNWAKEAGGLELYGTSLLVNCTLAGNIGNEFGGGAIKNYGGVTLLNCTINGNTAGGGGVGTDGGGGILNYGVVTMTNCTVSGNTAYWAYGSLNGGGIDNSIYLSSTGTVYSVDCTIVSNNASAGAGVANAGSFFVKNTILANNLTNDVLGAMSSLGYNLVKNTNGCTITSNSVGNIYGVDPLVGPLQNNGGFTFTHALLPGSPAINAGPTNAAPYFDERGLSRPYGPADDIGAFEFRPVPAIALTLVKDPTPGCHQVRLAGTAGFTYTIQSAPSPKGPWTPVTAVNLDGTGKGSCTNSNPAGNVFYRAVYP